MTNLSENDKRVDRTKDTNKAHNTGCRPIKIKCPVNRITVQASATSRAVLLSLLHTFPMMSAFIDFLSSNSKMMILQYRPLMASSKKYVNESVYSVYVAVFP